MPDSPTNLAFSAVSKGGTLTWTAPTNTGSGPLTGYVITVGPNVVDADAAATQATLTHLVNGATYTLSLVATNAFGSSAPATLVVTLPCETLHLGSLPVLDANNLPQGSTGVNGMLTGDFNGDGLEDLFVYTSSRLPVRVYPNLGDGGFGLPILSTTLDTPPLLAVATSGDGGNVDLLYFDGNAVSGTPNFAIMKAAGNGDGTFKDPIAITPYQMIDGTLMLADVNGDGIPDLIDADNSSRGYTVLFGAPDGGYPSQVTNPIYDPGGENIYFAADMDHDGLADLIVDGYPTSIYFYKGLGDGTFADAGGAQILNTTTDPIYSYGFVAGSFGQLRDLNGDGNLDLVLTGYDRTGNTSFEYGVGIFPTDGAGNWRTAQFLYAPYPTGVQIAQGEGPNFPTSFAIGDFNGDGRPDLAVPYKFGGTAIFTQLPDAGFSGLGQAENAPGTPLDALLPGSPDSNNTVTPLVALDVNDDGRTDLVGGGEALSVFLATPTGFDVPRSYEALDGYLQTYSTDVIHLDVNGDGLPDVVVLGNSAGVESGGAYPNPSSILAFANLGDGGLGYLATSTPFPDDTVNLRGIAHGDLNGDHIQDIVTYNLSGPTSVYVMSGDGAGHFTVAKTINFTGSIANVGVADFDGDGKNDIAVLTSGGLNIVRGYGDGGYAPAINVASPSGIGSPASMTVGDVDGNGLPDVVSQKFVFYNQGSLNFTTQTLGWTFGSAPEIADVNGDGLPDMVGSVSYDDVWLALNQGDGGWSAKGIVPLPDDAALTSSSTSPAFHNTALADMDGDGNLDVVVAMSTGMVGVALGHGDGTFDPPQLYVSAPILNSYNGSALDVADLNGDGRPDVVSEGGEQLTVLLNQASNTCWGSTGEVCDLDGTWSTGSSSATITQSGMNLNSTVPMPISGQTIATYWGDAVGYYGSKAGIVSGDCNNISWGTGEVWTRQ